MVLHRKTSLTAVVLGAGLVAALGAAGVGQASHLRPKAAPVIRESLIPAHVQCVAPNRTHNGPLAFPSCNPPVNVSPNLTTGTFDNNGLPSNMTAGVKLQMILSPPDMLLQASINDQYCKPTFTATCTNTGESLSDFVGGLNVDIQFRLTDHWSSIGGADRIRPRWSTSPSRGRSRASPWDPGLREVSAHRARR